MVVRMGRNTYTFVFIMTLVTLLFCIWLVWCVAREAVEVKIAETLVLTGIGGLAVHRAWRCVKSG